MYIITNLIVDIVFLKIKIFFLIVIYVYMYDKFYNMIIFEKN